MNATKKKPKMGNGVFHPSARPMKMQKDANGFWWLCDGDCRPNQPCAAEHCWSSDKIIFSRGG